MSRVGPKLRDLGWDAHWASLYEECAPCEPPGRVIRAGRLLLVQTEQLEILAECPTDHAPRPICGDWVTLKLHFDTRPNAVRGSVRATLPRRNAVVRQAPGTNGPQAILANIDAVWLVCGLDRDQGIRSLARYQALARLEQVDVTVVLNKLDLCEDLEYHRARAQAEAPDLDVISVSAYSRQGIEHLESRLPRGRTTALIGPSGVGKSTLINALAGTSVQCTKAVRKEDHRGYHTTSAGQLIATKSGALLVDTPGLRELGLWHAGGFDNTYADLLDLAKLCRFSDCRHDREPGCQVRQAIEQGTLSSERFLSYLELLSERRECVNHERRRRDASR